MSPVEGGGPPSILLPPPVTASYHIKVTIVTFCRKDRAGRLLVQGPGRHEKAPAADEWHREWSSVG